MKLKKDELKSGVLLLALLALGSFAYGGYRFYTLSNENDVLVSRVGELEGTLLETEGHLAQVENEKTLLAEALRNEQDRLDSIKGTIAEVTDTVSDLEKLAKLDPELLQKYSKVYFLNEHYVPDSLRDIPKENLYYEDERERIHSKVWRFLDDLLDEAAEDGVELYIVSGYRSFGDQGRLKSGYVFTYGAGTANTFSAEQGYSEHQLGTTVDFMTTGTGGTFSGFEDTEAYAWLLKNAHRFGFTLSYPEGNSYYQFEPWHWRFVGTDLARDLNRDGTHFYDVPQRDIDEYLLEIFD